MEIVDIGLHIFMCTKSKQRKEKEELIGKESCFFIKMTNITIVKGSTIEWSMFWRSFILGWDDALNGNATICQKK